MRRPTASQLDLARKCLAPWTSGMQWCDSDSAAARLGTAFHEIAAHCINGHIPKSSFLDVTDVKDRHNLSEDQAQTLLRMVAGWRDWFKNQPNMQAEIAFAYDPSIDTARVLSLPRGHRDYSLALAHEFVGTADVVESGAGVYAVTDWKCGQRRYVTLPKENRQLRFLALCAARVLGLDEGYVNLAFVDQEGEVEVESARIDAFELAVIAGEMALMAERLGANTEPQIGPHCRWCPAVASCPKSQIALAELAPVPPPAPYVVVTDPTAITTPDHATWLLHRWRAVKAAADVVEVALKQYADQHGGIATGDGSTWERREVPVERIRLDPSACDQLAVDLPGAVQYSASKKSIEDAARAAHLPIKSTREATMGMLRTLGAVTTSVTVKYEDRDPCA